MKLLIYDWSSFLQYDLYSVLDDMNISYDKFSYDFDHDGFNKQRNDDFVSIFNLKYSTKNYDAIFSISYWPVLSDAAMSVGIKYISWSYDCPLDVEKPEETFANPCNYIFLFDKIQFEKYKSLGIDTVYHLPLGIYKQRYEKYDTSSSLCDPFRADISFVGSLYTGSSAGIKSMLSDKTASILDQIVETQKKMPNQYILDKLITDSFISALNSEIEAINPNITGNLSASRTENTLAYEVTGYNRMMLLMLLGKRYNTNLYTSTEIKTLGNVNVHNGINYFTEMPLCFAASKINLNSTFISIQSGLPLRVLDIMASGGFLLSNKQSEFESMGYIDDKDVALFSSFGEALEKADYYINHDDARIKIAKCGRAKTFESHTLDKRITEILKLSC